MKKILALVLAVLMMATVAFAAAVTEVAPGAKLVMPLKDAVQGTTGLTYGPTDSVACAVTGASAWAPNKEIVAKNFTITAVKWTKGSALVKGVSINSDDEIVVELAQDYTQIVGVGPVKPIEGSFKVTQKGTGIVNTVTIGAGAITDVGYEEGEITLTTAGATATPNLIDNKTVYTVKKGTGTDGTTYGTMGFGDDLGNDISVRVYEKEKYFLDSSSDANLTVVKNNADVDADMRFVKFGAKPTFNATATYSIYADEKEFVYAIDDKGNLSKAGKWSADDGCWVIKTRTLGAYVISDKALKTVADTAADKNPDTGANDVVGIATALAAVALVSAAAVSLKK